MTIEIGMEEEKILTDLVAQGEFETKEAALREAILGLKNNHHLLRAPVYPPGTLAELYTQEENEKEARLVEALPLKLEAF